MKIKKQKPTTLSKQSVSFLIFLVTFFQFPSQQIKLLQHLPKWCLPHFLPIKTYIIYFQINYPK